MLVYQNAGTVQHRVREPRHRPAGAAQLAVAPRSAPGRSSTTTTQYVAAHARVRAGRPARGAARRGDRPGSRAGCGYELDGEMQLAVGDPDPVGGRRLLRDRLARRRARTPSSALGVSLRRRRRSSPPSPAPPSGWWASRRALRPAAPACRRAATALAAGRLDTRLEPSDDPDLRPITASFNDMAQALAGPHRAGRPLRVRRQPRAALAAHDAGRVDRGAWTTSATTCPTRARAALDLMVGRHRPLPAAGRGPARDLPLRRRRGPPRARGGPPRRAGDAGGEPLHRRRRARRARRRAGRRGRAGRQAPHRAGDRQPPRQRRQVRRRRHRRVAAPGRRRHPDRRRGPRRRACPRRTAS